MKDWKLLWRQGAMFFALVIFCCPTMAAPSPASIPGSVQPGVVSKNYMRTQTSRVPQKRTPPHITQQNEQQENPVSGAEKIKFKLTKITLEGNHIYSTAQLLPLYKDKLNHVISIADLQKIVEDITNYYRNNGYVLSRAVLPPQHINKGAVKIKIIEGFIDQVNILGKPYGARSLLLAYGKKVAKNKPLQIKNLERSMYLANEIPGMAAKSVLEPSKTTIGGADLNLVAEEKPFSVYVSYDNYGTLYIGPLQVTTSVTANSIFRSGDMTHVTYLSTTHAKELHFTDVTHQTPIGDDGLQLVFDFNRSLTAPGMNLRPIKLLGDAKSYSISLQYPVIRMPNQDLTIDGGITRIDSLVTILGSEFYLDHIRPLKFGGTYSFGDHFNGSNLIGLHMERGLNFFHASNDPTSVTVSRFGADAIFTKFVLQMSRLQFTSGRYSALIQMQGQYSFNPLLASEQFSYGGTQLGRGYDSGEILGDNGTGGTLELRMDTSPQWRLLNSAQLYVFYDVGVVWNYKKISGSYTKSSAASTGIGSRFTFSQYFSGNLMFAQPLTKMVSNEALVGRGKSPRVFFSLVASV